MRLSPFAFGTLITGLGVLILSPDAALIRLVAMDTYGLVFWRGLAMVLVIGIATVFVCRADTLRQFRTALMGTGSLIALLLTCGTFGFVLGAERGDPAFTVVAVAASPLYAALFSWLLFAERADRITLGAIALGFLGVSLGAFEVLGAGTAEMIGFFGAAIVPIMLGLAFTLTRFLPATQNTWAVYTLTGLFTLASGLLVGGDLSVPAGKMLPFLALVGIVVPFSFLLISLGPRYITAAQTSLMMLLETALSPLWVYLAVQLAPGPLTLAGGILLILTLIGQTLLQLRAGGAARRNNNQATRQKTNATP